MVGPHIPQLRHPLQNIGEMTQLVFQLLRGLIRGARKEAEGRHIGEIILFIKKAQVTPEGPAVRDDPRGLQHVRGNVQAGGKIIGGSGGNIADRNKGLLGIFHHPADYLIESPVPSRAHDIQIILLPLAYKAPRIVPAPRRIAYDLVVRFGKYLKDVQQGSADLRASRDRIKDKQDFFPGHFPSTSRSILPSLHTGLF